MNRIRRWVTEAETPAPLLVVLMVFSWSLSGLICVPIAIFTSDWSPFVGWAISLPTSGVLVGAMVAFMTWLLR